eukprot:63946-Amphidinium_carterae.1
MGISTTFLTANIASCLCISDASSLVPDHQIWLAVRAVYGLRAAHKLWEQDRDIKLAKCQFKVKELHCSFKQSASAPSVWWILKQDFKSQNNKLPRC